MAETTAVGVLLPLLSLPCALRFAAPVATAMPAPMPASTRSATIPLAYNTHSRFPPSSRVCQAEPISMQGELKAQLDVFAAGGMRHTLQHAASPCGRRARCGEAGAGAGGAAALPPSPARARACLKVITLGVFRSRIWQWCLVCFCSPCVRRLLGSGAPSTRASGRWRAWWHNGAMQPTPSPACVLLICRFLD